MIPETGKRDYSISQRNSDSGVIAQIMFQFTMVYYYYFSRRSKILLLRGGLLFIVHYYYYIKRLPTKLTLNASAFKSFWYVLRVQWGVVSRTFTG